MSVTRPSLPGKPIISLNQAYSDAINISWTYSIPTIPDTFGIHIEVATSTGGPYVPAISGFSIPNSQSWEAKNLLPNKQYYIRMYVTSNGVNSAYSDPLSVITLPAKTIVPDTSASVVVLVTYDTLPVPTDAYNIWCDSANQSSTVNQAYNFISKQAHKYGVASPISSVQCLGQVTLPAQYKTGNPDVPLNKALIASNLSTDTAIPSNIRAALSQAKFVEIVYYYQASAFEQRFPISDCCSTGYTKYGFTHVAPMSIGTAPAAGMTYMDITGGPEGDLALLTLQSLGAPLKIDWNANVCLNDTFTGKIYSNQDIMCGVWADFDDYIVGSSTAQYLGWLTTLASQMEIPFHPADVNNDGVISLSEMSNYAYCYKTSGCIPTNPPSPVSISFMGNAAYIWKNPGTSGTYHYDSTVTTAPQWWVPGQ